MKRKNWKYKSRWKKMMTRWTTWLTHTTSCRKKKKILGTRKLKRGVVL